MLRGSTTNQIARWRWRFVSSWSRINWLLCSFPTSLPIDKSIRGVVVKLTHCYSENKWLEMPRSAQIVPEKASEQSICPGEGHTVPVITQASLLEAWVCLSLISQLSDGRAQKRHMDVTLWTSILGQFLNPLSYVKCFSHQPITYNCHTHYIPLKQSEVLKLREQFQLEFVTTVRVCVCLKGDETQKWSDIHQNG